jgi:Zn-dependent protease
LFGTSWGVGRIASIEIRVDSSWVVIAVLITYSMYLRFSVLYKDLSTAEAVGIAILAAVLFFGSVLVHELAHAPVSRARGIRVQDITLFLFGGATRARMESRGPRDEFLIAAVGPLTSLLVAELFWIVDVFARGALLRSLIGMFGYLAWVNLLLAGFNLIPGFPLDGGRLLRSLVWRAIGSFRRATRIVSLAGPGGGMAAGGRRRGLSPGRESGRGHLVRVHRLVPGPGGPGLLPGAPADAARGSSAGRDGY